jgi:hypothetical protein
MRTTGSGVGSSVAVGREAGVGVEDVSLPAVEVGDGGAAGDA